MNFPSVTEIALADAELLERWFRWLAPGTPAEELILQEVTNRCTEIGVFDGAFWQRSRRATAIHEAGHAVVALKLGFPVLEVQITSDQEGFCLYADTSPASEEEKTRHIICLHAGKWAEATLGPKGSFRHACSQFDDESAQTLLLELCSGQSVEYVNVKREEIDTRLVEQVALHEAHIRRVAQELLNARKLTGPQIKTFFHRA